jgi:uncharacterized protein (DUF885 family)
MKPSISDSEADPRAIAAEMIDALKHQFPVCLSSDEFHFFPQAVPEIGRGSEWDDFSDERVAAVAGKLSSWETALRSIETSAASTADRIDAVVLRRIATALREQLTLVAPQRSQPTFHLTVLAIGLAEALEAGEEHWRLRIEAVPAFLERARKTLRDVPQLFHEMGLEMTRKISGWLAGMAEHRHGVEKALSAKERFDRHLRTLPGSPEFRLEPELYARVAEAHIGCALPVEEISAWLDREIAETRRLLEKESERMNPDRPWQETAARLSRPLSGETPEKHYRTIIDQLAWHCVEQGLVAPELVAATPIRVMPVPDHLRPVRSVAAYSMPPGHPPRGGTFFTAPGRTDRLPGDWELLTAHETYPGHHLLDARRWGLGRALRRHIEFPLFYEGWASFSEEVLFDTGFFSGGTNRFLMAKRRFWRAMRGRLDISLHWERRTPAEAATFMTDEGLDRKTAAAMVRRYALKPGYQLCYTIGRLKFRRLYDRWTEENRDHGEFVRRVMAEGEIGLDLLEEVLFGA